MSSMPAFSAYITKKCGPYNPEVDILRDLSVVRQIQEAQKTVLKYLSGDIT
jgi:hypothetical protein